MINLWKWLGVEKRIHATVAPAIISLEKRLTRLKSSQDALKVEVVQIKRLIDIIVTQNSPH